VNLSLAERSLCVKYRKVKKVTARWISYVQSSWRHVAAYVNQEVSHNVPRRSTGIRMVNSLIGSRTASKTVRPEDCASISFLSTFLSRFLRPWFLIPRRISQIATLSPSHNCHFPRRILSGNSVKSGKCGTLFVKKLQE